MKRCPKCMQLLEIAAFAKRRGGLRPTSYCKMCQRDYSKVHYRENSEKHNARRYVNQTRYRERNRRLVAAYLLQHPCVDCGESDLRVLDFDHTRPGKRFVISVMVAGGHPWRRIEEEIAKCAVRCANCHRKKTALDFGWYKCMGAGM